MLSYIIRRILLIIPSLVVVSVIVFISIRLIPGSIIDQMVMQHAGGGDLPTTSEMTVSPEGIRHELGLDVPFYVQYGRWVREIIVHGNLGTSLWTKSTVTQEMRDRMPVTFELGFLAFIIAQSIAIPVAIYSALRQDTWIDYLFRSVSIVGLAVPHFWLATLIMTWPSIWWGWAPSMEYIPFIKDPLGNLEMFIIPALILGTGMSASAMRYTRTMMLEVLRQDYIRTAWSKGLRQRVIVFRHALRNALIPVITIIAGELGVMIGGSVILEQIFSLPGMGRLLLDVLNKRDYLMVSGFNLLFATIAMFMILATDLSYAYLDPRVRYR